MLALILIAVVTTGAGFFTLGCVVGKRQAETALNNLRDQYYEEIANEKERWGHECNQAYKAGYDDGHHKGFNEGMRSEEFNEGMRF